MNPLHLFLAFCGGMSVLAFLLYGIDKRRAVRHKWRIPEATLLATSFLGGAFGALLGMKLFRHKTRHWYFYATALLGAAWQIAVGVILYLHTK